MDKENKKSGLLFLPVGILSYIALNALMIFLDVRGLFDVAELYFYLYLAVPILLPVIWAKAANRKIIDSVLFMSMGILAAFIVNQFIPSSGQLLDIYERHFPNLDREFIAQKMHHVTMAVFFQLIETILLILTTFTVKIIIKIHQINKQFNSYKKSLSGEPPASLR